MKTNDYVKYMTEQLVTYIDSPADTRKQNRAQRKQEKEPFLHRWFGVLPVSIELVYKKYKTKKGA